LRQLLLLILTTFLFTDSFGQTVDTTITLGWQDTYDKLPTLTFENINLSEFLNYKKNYRSKLNTDTSKVVSSDTAFTIRTSKSKFSFPKPPPTSSVKTKNYYVYYKGFNDHLKIYVLESYSVGSEFTFGFSFFIDSISNVKYELIEHSDYSFQPPVFSPDNRFMITYVYDLLSPNECFLGVIKITADKDSFSYKEFASATTELIEELVWINNSSFAMKVNHQTYNEKNKNWDDNFAYLKTTLPKIKND